MNDFVDQLAVVAGKEQRNVTAAPSGGSTSAASPQLDDTLF